MENPIYEIDGGVSKKLLVYQDRCVICALKNVWSFITKDLLSGNKEFYFSDLTSVQMKPYGKITSGFIQFEYPGSHSGGNNYGSENSFVFTSSGTTNEKMSEVYEFIKSKIKEAKTTKTPVLQVSAADELRKFKELLDMGVITQEEFDAKKKAILQ